MIIDKSAFEKLASSPRVKPVSVDGLGDVHICELSVEAVDAIGKAGSDHPSAALWLRYGICTSAGVELFTDDDLPMLRRLPHEVASKLSTEVIEFNGLGVKASEAAKNG